MAPHSNSHPVDNGSGQPIQVIVSADDFGSSPTVNAAVIEAHRHGVLTSASLMVGGECAEEAAALARATPTLAVGLHLVVVDGPAVLPSEQIPHLLDQRGCFPDTPVRTGLRYALDRRVREELRHEIEAQFARFAATGLPLSHVDGHQHMHLHPVVFDLLVPLAMQYGARGMRLPRDKLWLALGYDGREAGMKIAWALIFGVLSRRSQARLVGCSLVTTHQTYGLMQSGHMDERYVLQVLDRLSVPTAELYFHPDTQSRAHGRGSNLADLRTLLSPTVARAVHGRGLRLVTYGQLAPEEERR